MRQEGESATSSELRHEPLVTAFFEKSTCSIQYVVADSDTKQCALIDPVLDFEPKSGATSTHSADALLRFIEEQGYAPVWILDTHPHADHFSAAGCLKDRTSARTGIGEKVVEVQRLWKDIYNLPESFRTDGSQWDKLFADGERFEIGNLTCEVLFSPGHTLASITYLVSDAAFIHDTLFMPDGGTARCDSLAAAPVGQGGPLRVFGCVRVKKEKAAEGRPRGARTAGVRSPDQQRLRRQIRQTCGGRDTLQTSFTTS